MVRSKAVTTLFLCVLICIFGSYIVVDYNILNDLGTNVLFNLKDIGQELKQDPKPEDDRLYQPSDWKEVDGSQRKLFIYSAWLDNRSKEAVIRIIAISYAKLTSDIQCVLYTENETKVAGGKVYPIHEGWNLTYVSAFIICPCEGGSNLVREVSIQAPGSNLNNSGPKLPVQPFGDARKKEFLSICVNPFHSQYNEAIWVVEFIELHRILGVNHFFFYNHTKLGEDLDKVLKSYVDRGVATVLTWNLPVQSKVEIRIEGIFSALNDCNLRSVGKFVHAMFIDVDEYIIPQKHNNYRELLLYLGNYNEYVFQNVFFYRKFDNDTAVKKMLYGEKFSPGVQLFGSEESGPYLLTAYKTTRETVAHPHGVRSKYICKPNKVIEVGSHYTWHHVDGGSNRTLVNQHIGASHHYRGCNKENDCLEKDHFSCGELPSSLPLYRAVSTSTRARL